MNCLTFMHARVLVLEDRQLVDPAELFKEGPQIFLIQISRYLAHKELDGVLLFATNSVSVAVSARGALTVALRHSVLQSSHCLGELTRNTRSDYSAFHTPAMPR